MNLLDMILLSILGLAAWKGYKKGIFTTLSSVAGYVVGLVGTFILYPPLRNILNEDFKVGAKIAPWVADLLALPAATFQARITDLTRHQLVELINQKDLPEVFKKIMIDFSDEFVKLPVDKGVNTLGDGIVFLVSDFLVSVITVLILFGGLGLVFRVILPKIFNRVTPGPLTFLDKLGGALIGTCGGLIALIILIIILVPLAALGSLQGSQGLLTTQMHESVVVNTLMDCSQNIFSTVFARGSV